MPRKRLPEKNATPKKSGPSVGKPVAGDQSAPARRAFPIVGLGASAGGLEALKAFFAKVPADSGMAYIVVVHMAPTQPSMMPALLQRVAAIPVATAGDGQRIAADRVYVAPPDKDLSVYRGRIQLLDAVRQAGALPIDLFLRSLAQDRGHQAAAIVLSGTGTDGSLGVREIKAAEGLVLAQSEASAGYDGMPRSAIDTGLVDLVLAPDEMPQTLVRYFAHAATALRPHAIDAAAAATGQQPWLDKVFVILRAQIGHDFSGYKANTILRRIARRMGLHRIDDHDTYVRFLRENPGEVEALFRELLIGVTRFFRDHESFEVLAGDVLPGTFEAMKEDVTFRAWVPGCSTGEEVYSLAIVLRESLEKAHRRIQLQLFGTDIDDKAIEKARDGLFPASVAADLGPVRLRRYFVQEGDHYRVRKEIRDCAVFSIQDVLKDAPFSRLNLLCCRNLLIYLDTEAQRKLLPLFHYTLRPGGILVLGASESIGGFSHLFKPLNKKWKIYKRQEVPSNLRQFVDFPSGLAPAETLPDAPAVLRPGIGQSTQRLILEQFAPTAILTDAEGCILHVQGRTGKYLEATSGPPTSNILDLVREGLRIELSSALREARSSARRVTRRRIAVKTNGETQMIDLHVCPQQAPPELAGRFLVVFEDIADGPPQAGGVTGGVVEAPAKQSRIAELERELQITRESHQTTIEELESSNEELKSTNEEMQSANEELQSANEELESSKEELQSLNEELQTVNAELQSNVEELSAVHDDMRNLLNSTEIATIFVDNDMRIRRFTTEATTIVNLIHADIGRPLKHVVSNLDYDGMLLDLAQVLKSLAPRDVEVRTADGKWYKMRVMPYRTADNRIDGAVLTFSSIDDQKKAQGVLEAASRKSEQAQELVRAIFDTSPDPLAVIDRDGGVVVANNGFCELAEVCAADIAETNFFSLKTGFLDLDGLHSPLKAALQQGRGFKTEPMTTAALGGKRRFAVQGRIIKTDATDSFRMLLQFFKAPRKGEK